MTYQNSKKNSSKYKKNYNEISSTNKFYLVPIIFIVSILPFITRYYKYKTPLSKYPWYSVNNEYTDFFLHYKQVFFYFCLIIMIIILGINLYKKKKIKYSPIFIPLAIYAVLTILSSFVSKYRDYTLTGSIGQFESVFVLLGYCFIVFYVYQVIEDEKDIRLISFFLIASIIINSILGLTQLLNHDFFASQSGLRLITPRSFWGDFSSISFNTRPHTIYLALFNPNYVGVYVSLLLPVVIIMMIFAKRLWLIAVYLLALVGLVVCLIGSKSTTGLVSVFLALLLIIIMLWRYLVKYYFISLPIIVIALLSVIVVNIYNPYISNGLKKLSYIKKSDWNLTEIQTNNNEVVIKYKGNDLRVAFNVDEANHANFSFLDDSNQIVNSTYDAGINNGTYTLQDQRFVGITVYPTLYIDLLSFVVTIDGRDWIFTNQTGDNSYYYINKYGREVKIVPAPSELFTGYEQYGSGRGFIWSRTIPLLKNNLLLGTGADTFIMDFPQQDYVNLYNSGYGESMITKPHNFFLQTAVQTGTLSLIIFLIFYGMYFISSFKLYIKSKFTTYYSQMGLGLFIGTFGYIISGLTNDSTITVAPVFWCIIALGLTVNKLVANENEKRISSDTL